MNFILLTHSQELAKSSNTGRLVLESLGVKAERVVWQRKLPDESLLRIIDEGDVCLLYPGPAVTGLQAQLNSTVFSSCIILDGTWQEARKIYNRSAYLHALPCLTLNPEVSSKYRLRRNQKPDGLSTVETVIEVLKLNDEAESANKLLAHFDDFQQRLKPLTT